LAEIWCFSEGINHLLTKKQRQW